MHTACTQEIDEAASAVSDILTQLDCETNLLAHSVGIVTCHADFLASGVLKAVCDSLPFDVVGTTTLGAAVQGPSGPGASGGYVSGQELLTVSVLTSDDVTFVAVLTDSLAADQEGPIRAAAGSSAAGLPQPASLVLVYAPLLQHVGGERLVRMVTEATGGAPLFGTLTCDHNFDFRDARVIHNGEAYADRMAMVLLSGPVGCRFMTISVPERNAERQSAVITGSEGNVVKEVNGVPVLDYLESIGLSRDAGLEGSKSIPVILDYNDGTPAVARCFYMISPEGHAVCGGEMPAGATFALSSMEAEDVILSAEQILGRIAGRDEVNGMLVMSCIVRSVTLGVDQMAEARRVGEKLAGGGLPYQLCYSGGEMCPVYQGEGGTANRFHNFSFAVCLFEG